MRAFFFALIVALTAAFTPGLTPKPAALTQRRVEPPAITMMPKFLKDLFPDMEKPGARFAERKSAWLRINRQASVRPNQHHTRTTSAPHPCSEFRRIFFFFAASTYLSPCARQAQTVETCKCSPLFRLSNCARLCNTDDVFAKISEFFSGLMPTEEETAAAAPEAPAPADEESAETEIPEA